MDKLLKAVLSVQELTFRTDDDFVDRLNRQYTPSVFVLFTVMVTMKQYVGDPIHCWCPAQFTSSHQEYANTACWVSNTYYVPMEDQPPEVDEPRAMISYYQWVPLILLSQAVIFFLPCITWRFLNHRSGLNIAALMDAAQSSQNAIYLEAREKTVRYVVMQLDSFLMAQRKYQSGWVSRLKQALSKYCCIFCGRFNGNYLTVSYLAVKTLYIANAVGQLFLLDFFLGMRSAYRLYGLRVMSRFFTGSDWSSSERFPRVTLCDFQIRQMTNVHRYTVQCVLAINLFNEKIFIFIWFWLFFVTLTTIFNLFHWLQKTVYLPAQANDVKKQLRSVDKGKREPKTTKRFTEQYLRRDGLLLLRLLGKNAGDLLSAEVLRGLWLMYNPDRHIKGESSSGPRQSNTYSNCEGSRWASLKGLVIRPKRPSAPPDEETGTMPRLSTPEEV